MKVTIKDQQAKIRSLEREVKKYQEEVKEYQEMVLPEREKVKDLEKSKESAEHLRYAMYDSYIQERTELIGRLRRIDCRILALNFLPPDDRFTASGARSRAKRREAMTSHGEWRDVSTE